MSIARVAANLSSAWHTANGAVLEAGCELLINDPERFDGVRVVGVGEHVWSHTSRGGKYVTVIIDLTPVRDGTGASRLLDMVPGRSKKVLKTWLDQQEQGFRDRIETVAMDGFTGFKTAAAEEIPQAVAVMDPFHVVALAGDALDRCRQRIQQTTCGHRGRSGDPLYGIRRVLRTGADLLTDRQCGRLSSVFTANEHAAVEATWGIYQRIVQAYRNPDRVAAKQQLTAVIQDLAGNVPASLTEVITLGRTLKRRAGDVLAYFDRPGTSNGPTPRPSMAASSTSVAPRWASATSPTTSSDPSSTPADSDPCYTVKCDEPVNSSISKPFTDTTTPTFIIPTR